MKRSLILLCLMTSSLAFASGVDDCDDPKLNDIDTMMKAAQMVADDGGCPNAKKLKFICMSVDSQTEDETIGANYKYTYQKKLLEAACVDVEKDSETVTSQKIKKMWNQFADKLVCSNLQFDVQNGSLVKFAVVSKFDAFISDVTKWKVNLNRVDESDQRTVLDYVKYHMEKNKGNPIEAKMKEYYKWLRDAGAKHKSEL